MKKIDELRKQIDSVDLSMQELFIKRLEILKEIAAFKKDNDLPIYDESRETMHKNDLMVHYPDDTSLDYYGKFLNNLIDLAKKYELGGYVDTLEVYDRNFIGCLKDTIKDKKCLFIYDSNVDISNLKESLNLSKCFFYEFHATEENKCMNTVDSIISVLCDKNFNNDDFICGLGGGITLDVAGFASSIYHRGIRYLSIPTTLLAMVDASLGGKCGVNVNHIKNQIGSFYNPYITFINVDYLNTLKKDEFACGMAEVIKMFITTSKDLFSKLEKDELQIEELIKNARSIKRTIISMDPLDKNIRHVLNFGHTFGHAIETLLNGKVKHGEAVSIGMMKSSSNEVILRLEPLLKRFNLPTESIYSFNDLKDTILYDKKWDNKDCCFIYCNKIGSNEMIPMDIIDLEKQFKGE